MKSSIVRAAVLLLTISACSKSGGGSAEADAGAAPSAATSGSASAASDGGSAKPSTATAGKEKETVFSGTYSSSAAKLYIPEAKDWEHTKQAKDDGSQLVGDGALTLTVAADGSVTGSIDTGPASPALISGQSSGDLISGTIYRKDPKDDGLTGSFRASIAAGKIDGTISLANANASILRAGKISAQTK